MGYLGGGERMQHGYALSEFFPLLLLRQTFVRHPFNLGDAEIGRHVSGVKRCVLLSSSPA